MKVDLNKAQADLDKLRKQKLDMLERIENITQSENQLVAFINMSQQYATTKQLAITIPSAEQRVRRAIAAKDLPKEKADARFQPHKFPPQPIPEGYVSQNRRMELVRRIVEKFPGDTVITTKDIAEGLSGVYTIPENARSQAHHIGTILFHEKGPASAVEKIGDQRWRVRANGLEVVQSRIAAEIAATTEAAARAAAH